MNLYHLRYFVTLAHLEHYTKAAAKLNITQPNLSYAINTLEEELGVSLFEKDGRNIVLSRCGREFLEEVEKSLSILDGSVRKMQLIGRGEGQIELGFLRTLGTRYIPETLAAFLKTEAGKNVTFHFHDGITADLIPMLKDKVCDVVFCSYAKQEPEVAFVPVGTQDLYLIVPRNHPLSDKTSICLEETLPYSHIFFNHRSGLRPIVDQLFQKTGGMPKVVMEIEEDQVIAGFVAAGFGIAVVPDMAILSQLPVKRIAIESPKWERRFYMAYMKDQYRIPAVSHFIQFVENQNNL